MEAHFLKLHFLFLFLFLFLLLHTTASSEIH
jgi:hypothetical protein